MNIDDFRYSTIWTFFDQDSEKKMLMKEAQEAWDHQEEHNYQACILYQSTTTSCLGDTR